MQENEEKIYVFDVFADRLFHILEPFIENKEFENVISLSRRAFSTQMTIYDSALNLPLYNYLIEYSENKAKFYYSRFEIKDQSQMIAGQIMFEIYNESDIEIALTLIRNSISNMVNQKFNDLSKIIKILKEIK